MNEDWKLKGKEVIAHGEYDNMVFKVSDIKKLKDLLLKDIEEYDEGTFKLTAKSIIYKRFGY